MHYPLTFRGIEQEIKGEFAELEKAHKTNKITILSFKTPGLELNRIETKKLLS